MKHVIEFNKINEEDEYIDIFDSDIKGQIIDILDKYDIQEDDFAGTDFEKLVEELANLVK